MASVDWLTVHYLAKSKDRLVRLANLPINQGDKVLDLCCGPGLFIPHLLDLVGPEGHVTGLDLDAVSLDAAHDRLMATPHKNWTLIHKKLDPSSLSIADYDVVLMFNCLGYFDYPKKVVNEIALQMRPGAILIIKDFDLEGFFFHPRDTSHWAALLTGAKTSDESDNPVKFSNFLGRRLHALSRVHEFRSVESETWTQTMVYPFSDAQREYIWKNVECLIAQAEGRCNSEAIEHFKSMFYPPRFEFFEDPEAVFVEIEFLIYLTV